MELIHKGPSDGSSPHTPGGLILPKATLAGIDLAYFLKLPVMRIAVRFLVALLHYLVFFIMLECFS